MTRPGTGVHKDPNDAAGGLTKSFLESRLPYVRFVHYPGSTPDLCYKWYIGDGDSSSFSEVVTTRPYEETVTIEKRECIGHVQKRIGTRCRTLRNTLRACIHAPA